MKRIMFVLFIAVMSTQLMAQQRSSEQYNFEIVGEFDENVGNIAVSQDARIFVSFLPLSNPKYKVMEVVNGKLKPFPNKKTSEALSAVIAVRVSKEGVLYVIDMAGTLYGYDIATRKTVKEINPKSQMHDLSYLQDFALDQKNNFIYIAEMSRGNGVGPSTPSIISVNLETGDMRKCLTGHPSVQSDGGLIDISGHIFSTQTPSGKYVPSRYGLNPITISSDYSYVYYGALNGEKVFRVPTEVLRDFSLTEVEMEAAVSFYGPKAVSDGISIDDANNVYVSDVNNYGIGVTKPNGKYELLFSDPRIVWPDGFSCGGDGMMYVTINKLHLNAGANRGVQESKGPYLIGRFKPLAKVSVGR